MSDDLPSNWRQPEWYSYSRPRSRDWINYVSHEMAMAWDTFTMTQRQMIARQAQKLANKEGL